MKLDKVKLLGEAKEYYGRGGVSDQSYDFSSGCVDLGQEWLDTYKSDYGALMRKSPSEMRKELRGYVKKRVNYKKYNTYSFLPTFVWVWLAQTIISWIVKKIIEHILNKDSAQRYL